MLLIVSCIPYAIFIGIIAIIIGIITTKKIASKTLKTLAIIVILLYATIILGSFQSETPDSKHIRTKEINDNKTLIGLTEEETIKLLGEPNDEYKNKEGEKQYTYSAGSISKKTYWGYASSSEYYEFCISFDKNNKVKETTIKQRPISP